MPVLNPTILQSYNPENPGFRQHDNPGPTFTRQDYMRAFKEISSATASRDLKEATDNKILKRTGDKRTSIYRFK